MRVLFYFILYLNELAIKTEFAKVIYYNKLQKYFVEWKFLENSVN